MTFAKEIQSLSPSAIIELFVLDMSALDSGIAYFHAGTNELQQPVVWQGVTYLPLPIEAEGFDVTGKGASPRPKMRVANVNGLFSAQVRQNDDLIGCRVVRKRTFLKYLDAVNFPDGINPDADPNQCMPDDLWFVDRKATENKYLIEWELASAFDLQGVMLPYRQVIQNTCCWRYRSPECGWTGTYFDKNDKMAISSKDDFCAKKLSSCKVRWGVRPLPYGGFPGAIRHG